MISNKLTKINVVDVTQFLSLTSKFNPPSENPACVYACCILCYSS